MTNKEIYREIQRYALQSYFYSRKAVDYFTIYYYTYAPMIKDEVWNAYLNTDDVVGVEAIEQAIGRRIKVDELIACPLSTQYFLFGNPIVEETEEASVTLDEFADLISQQIKRAETRTRNYLLKELSKHQE